MIILCYNEDYVTEPSIPFIGFSLGIFDLNKNVSGPLHIALTIILHNMFFQPITS